MVVKNSKCSSCIHIRVCKLLAMYNSNLDTLKSTSFEDSNAFTINLDCNEYKSVSSSDFSHTKAGGVMTLNETYE